MFDVRPFQNPKVWGPYTWYLLHGWSFSHNNDLIKYYRSAYNLLGNRIPCPSCRNHFNDYRRRNPPRFDTKENHIKWVIDFHNNVNKRLKKPILSQQKVKSIYLDQNGNFKWHSGRWSLGIYVYLKWIFYKTKGKHLSQIMSLLKASLGNIEKIENRNKVINSIDKFPAWKNTIFVEKLIQNIKLILNS